MEQIYFEDLSREKLYQCYVQLYNGDRWSIPPHWHFYAEVIYVTKGCLQLFLSGDYHTIAAGQLAFIDSQAVHAFKAAGNQTVEMSILKFDKRPVLGLQDICDPFFAYLLNSERRLLPEGFIFQRQQAADSADHIQRILEETRELRFGYELAVRTSISGLFLWIVRQQEETYLNTTRLLKPLSDPFMKKLTEMMAYMHEHYRESLTAETAAGRCHMSYSYFSRKFKEVSGKTFSEYLNLVRVLEAEKLLTASSLSVTEIALEVGFGGTSYFIKQFRNLRGLTPLQFRKKLLA